MVDLTPEEKQRIYLEEKARLEAGERVRREAKKKRGTQWGLGCLLAFLLVILLFALPWPRGSSSSTSANLGPRTREILQAAPPAAPAITEPLLELVDWNWTTEYDYAIAQGRVKNISSQPIRNVEALVTWETKGSEFITSDSSLIDYNPILPGQTSSFKVMEPENPAMSKAYVEFKTLGGGTLLTRKREKK